jgi:hypothetical protein
LPGAPRTDPYVRNYRIRLLPWVSGVEAHTRMRNFSHTAQPDRRGAPALQPGLGRLRGVPLGRPPSLHCLRQWREPIVVRRFLWYYGAVRLPVSVHVGRVVISLLRPAHRTNSGGRRRDPPGSRAGSFHAYTGSSTPLDSLVTRVYRHRRCCLPLPLTASASRRA